VYIIEKRPWARAYLVCVLLFPTHKMTCPHDFPMLLFHPSKECNAINCLRQSGPCFLNGGGVGRGERTTPFIANPHSPTAILS